MTMTMTDRELQELAAKAAGYRVRHWCEFTNTLMLENDPNGLFIPTPWRPLTDGPDSRRLEDKLNLATGIDDRFKDLGTCIFCTYQTGEFSCNSIMLNIEKHGGYDAAIKRARVLAAAEISKIFNPQTKQWTKPS